ncbi:threonine--tRNA ligase MST1 [Ascoidea rubescens DSM 1968]|uniref:threonine--tRNA ligase n=1 Tax=Ascoidea rubescens DSM 1968 TaxID=1344418 RepID=A0A1D2VHC4_9ASCO|nr:threonyl-tRNA synthetase mitochondrial precursor [Ascoidea rubescens DSM 1968]ODV60887.1 threonyl-tRNA synthetase mitochondrial precursor [Ascoidea rubescens DSM 1968]
MVQLATLILSQRRFVGTARWVRWCSSEAADPRQVPSSSTVNSSISNRQELYMIDAVSPGSIFFLPHGTRLINKLVSFMKLQQMKLNFDEVMTPLLYRKSLWEKSGHWDNYKDDMFVVKSSRDDEKESFGLKPMNCPGHCLIYLRKDRSYNELPIRYSDFSSLHRNEQSGALSGLTRVRRFHQDDAHIFCTIEQIKDEINNNLRLVDTVYKTFGINDYKLLLSTRPSEKYIGELADWDAAESNLKQVLESTGKKWEINEGDGAFYGPKVDILLKDNFGKEHQSATIQLDFQLPQRFKLTYKDSQGLLKTPVMIHRAIYGSIERFLAILIDHYEGKWPFWLSPRQAIVLPVSNEHHLEFSQDFQKKLSGFNNDLNNAISLSKRDLFDVDMDSRSVGINRRIKNATQKGYNYIIVIGEKEINGGQIAVRNCKTNQVEHYSSVDELREKFVELTESFQ